MLSNSNNRRIHHQEGCWWMRERDIRDTKLFLKYLYKHNILVILEMEICPYCWRLYTDG